MSKKAQKKANKAISKNLVTNGMLCHAVLIEPRFNDSCSVGKDGKGDVHAIGYDPEGIVLLGKVSEPFLG